MRIYKRGREERQGVALLYAVFVAFVAAGMVTVMFSMAGVSNKRSGLRTAQVEARYLAQGAAEAAKKEITEAVANWTSVPAEGMVTIDGAMVEYVIDDPSSDQTLVDATGLQTVHRVYEIRSRAEVRGVPLSAHRLVGTESTPVFQFAVFYDGDLEIYPGPSMSLGGRVHSNADMYLGSGGTLTMDTNYVHAVGDIYRSRKNGSTSTGNVRIREWVANPFDPGEPSAFVDMLNKGQLSGLGASSTSGYDSLFTEGYDADGDGFFDGALDLLPFAAGALELWNQADDYGSGTGATVQTGAHDVSQANAPGVGSVAKFDVLDGGDFVLDRSGEAFYVGPGLGTHAKGYYHQNAGLTILVNAGTSSFEAFLAGGVSTMPDGTSVASALIAAGVVDLDSIADLRQSSGSNERTPVVEIDMAALNASGLFPVNGLLYASHYGLGEGTDCKGVMLKGGAELQDKLTVVTDGSAYVHGDFNITNKKGAAVIADGVNLLSNAWDGSKTASGLPNAAETTYNMAMITGNQSSTASSYGGGFENLPRFHERWTGVPCNITGSFVNTWESVNATGAWMYGGNRYTPPGRNWAYDPAFNSVDNLPPFTPMVVIVRDVVSW